MWRTWYPRWVPSRSTTVWSLLIYKTCANKIPYWSCIRTTPKVTDVGSLWRPILTRKWNFGWNSFLFTEYFYYMYIYVTILFTTILSSVWFDDCWNLCFLANKTLLGALSPIGFFLQLQMGAWYEHPNSKFDYNWISGSHGEPSYHCTMKIFSPYF